MVKWRTFKSDAFSTPRFRMVAAMASEFLSELTAGDIDAGDANRLEDEPEGVMLTSKGGTAGFSSNTSFLGFLSCSASLTSPLLPFFGFGVTGADADAGAALAAFFDDFFGRPETGASDSEPASTSVPALEDARSDFAGFLSSWLSSAGTDCLGAETTAFAFTAFADAERGR
jgi:hypothetical protein